MITLGGGSRVLEMLGSRRSIQPLG